MVKSVVDQCYTNVEPMLDQCETNAQPMLDHWSPNVQSMLNQCWNDDDDVDGALEGPRTVNVSLMCRFVPPTEGPLVRQC